MQKGPFSEGMMIMIIKSLCIAYALHLNPDVRDAFSVEAQNIAMEAEFALLQAELLVLEAETQQVIDDAKKIQSFAQDFPRCETLVDEIAARRRWHRSTGATTIAGIFLCVVGVACGDGRISPKKAKGILFCGLVIFLVGGGLNIWGSPPW